MNENLRIFMNFKGWGNPRGCFWFIGIEEAQEFSEKEIPRLLTLYRKWVCASEPGDYDREKKEFLKTNPGKRFTSVYEIMGKIVKEVRGKDNLDDFLNNELFTENGEIFQSNIYPLGKRSLRSELPEHYKKYFGLRTREEYFHIVETKRFEILRKYWAERKRKVTICFGKTIWDQFKALFRLGNDYELVNDGMIIFYPNEKIYLTPFFMNRWMSHARIEILGTHIRDILSDA
jgi:hypothetical protein